MPLEKICLNIIRWGTYLTLLTPLVVVKGFFFLFVGPKTLYFCGLTEIIFFVWLGLAIFKPDWRPRKNPLLVALGVFLLCLLLSAVFGADISKSFWSNFERMTGLLTMLHLFAFFVVLTSVFRSKADWQRLFVVSVATASSVSIISIFPKLGLPDILRKLPAQDGATLGNSSFLAAYLLLNGFLALYLLFNKNGRLKTFVAMGFTLIILALFASTGYAAILSFFLAIALLICLWLLFKTGPLGRLLAVVFLGLIVIAGFTLLVMALQSSSPLHQGIVEHFSKSRLIVWNAALEGFKERPLLGWGPENFDLAFYKHFHPCLVLPLCSPKGEIWFDRSHSIFFDTLVTTGLLGVLSYLAILALAFFALWQGYRKGNLDFWTTGIFSVALLAYLVQNLTVFDMVSTYLMFFLLLAAIANGFGETASPAAAAGAAVRVRPSREGLTLTGRGAAAFKFWRKNILIVSGLAIAFILSMFLFVIQPLRADYYIIAGLSNPDIEERLTFFKKALSASPMGKYQIREFFTEAWKGEGRNDDSLKPALDFTISELTKTIRSSPLNFRSYLTLGELYNFYGQIGAAKFSEAKAVLEKAIKLSPTNQYGYWALSDTEMALGDFQEAISLLETAVSLEPRFDRAHLRLITGLLQIGDRVTAEQKAREAVQIIPSLSSDIAALLQRY